MFSSCPKSYNERKREVAATSLSPGSELLPLRTRSAGGGTAALTCAGLGGLGLPRLLPGHSGLLSHF